MTARAVTASAVRVGVLPTLPYHAGLSMQVYAAGVMESLAGVPGIDATLLTPPFAVGPRPGRVRSRWIRHVTYPAWAAEQPADVYHVVDHGNAQLLRRLPHERTVVTCHDLYPLALATGRLRVPGAASRISMLPTALRLRGLRRARLVLTVSEHTRGECRRYLGIPDERLRVVHESVAAAAWSPCDEPAVAATQARLGLGPDTLTVLHVGSNDPRKNLGAVCRVVARLRARTGRAVRLVKVGAPFGAAERELLDRAGLPAGIVREAGRVSPEELVRVYHAATALLYPSYYEGFCRPVVEAMAAGLPVVAARAGAIPEVTGGAAALHAPDDIEGMAERLVAIAGDHRLRHQMSEAGRAVSRRFAGADHGRVLADVYREVYRDAGGAAAGATAMRTGAPAARGETGE